MSGGEIEKEITIVDLEKYDGVEICAPVSEDYWLPLFPARLNNISFLSDKLYKI